VVTARSDACGVLLYASRESSVAATGPGKGKVSGGATHGVGRVGGSGG